MEAADPAWRVGPSLVYFAKDAPHCFQLKLFEERKTLVVVTDEQLILLCGCEGREQNSKTCIFIIA
jgi:hypothetical protein